MELPTILAVLTQAQAAIRSGRLLLELVGEQIALAKQNGQLTPEQIGLIERQQHATERQWDDAVAAARARTGRPTPTPPEPPANHDA